MPLPRLFMFPIDLYRRIVELKGPLGPHPTITGYKRLTAADARTFRLRSAPRLHNPFKINALLLRTLEIQDAGLLVREDLDTPELQTGDVYLFVPTALRPVVVSQPDYHWAGISQIFSGKNYLGIIAEDNKIIEKFIVMAPVFGTSAGHKNQS